MLKKPIEAPKKLVHHADNLKIYVLTDLGKAQHIALRLRTVRPLIIGGRKAGPGEE
jgi:hypothetical protein